MDASDDHRDHSGEVRGGERCPHPAPGPPDAGPTRDAPAPALRNPPGMLHQLGGHLGWHQRTAEVNDELERQLRCLDRFAWHMVRDLPISSVAIPILLFGPAGTFLLQGSRGFWTDEDVALMSRAARTLGAVIRDYPDPVRPAIVILDGPSQERQHFTGTGEGPCWVVNDARLISWLSRYQDHGFSEGDIARLREEADPARISEVVRNLVPKGTGHVGESHQDCFFSG